MSCSFFPRENFENNKQKCLKVANNTGKSYFILQIRRVWEIWDQINLKMTKQVVVQPSFQFMELTKQKVPRTANWTLLKIIWFWLNFIGRKNVCFFAIFIGLPILVPYFSLECTLPIWSLFGLRNPKFGWVIVLKLFEPIYLGPKLAIFNISNF